MEIIGMEGKITYYSSGLFKSNPDTYNLPEAYFPGINSDMYAQYMDFTSWSYTHEGDGKWKESSTKPAPDLRIENELPNWEAPKKPTTGTVTKGQLEAMGEEGGIALLLDETSTVHAILTRHNYNDSTDFRERMKLFKARKENKRTHDDNGKEIAFYDLDPGDFLDLADAMEVLHPGKITYK